MHQRAAYHVTLDSPQHPDQHSVPHVLLEPTPNLLDLVVVHLVHLEHLTQPMHQQDAQHAMQEVIQPLVQHYAPNVLLEVMLNSLDLEVAQSVPLVRLPTILERRHVVIALQEALHQTQDQQLALYANQEHLLQLMDLQTVMNVHKEVMLPALGPLPVFCALLETILMILVTLNVRHAPQEVTVLNKAVLSPSSVLLAIIHLSLDPLVAVFVYRAPILVYLEQSTAHFVPQEPSVTQ